jgi:hypothetical protein
MENLMAKTKPESAQAAPGLVGCVFDIQRFSLHDGPGIRTTVFLKGCPPPLPLVPQSRMGERLCGGFVPGGKVYGLRGMRTRVLTRRSSA